MLCGEMREVETDSSVIWPSWCYNTGENKIETDSLKSRSLTKSPVTRVKKSRRSTTSISSEKRPNGINVSISNENRCLTPSAFSTNSTSSVTSVTTGSNTTAVSTIKMEVKTERLSPSSAITDNNSSGSGSNTPSSSYPGTPPNSNNHNDRVPSPSLSPAAQMSHSKMMEQPMARNYSDIMRSLAAKYNNTNPNDYYSTSKNGFTGTFGDPRFSSFKTNSTSPFVNLVPSLNSDSNSPPNVLNSSCHLTPSNNTKDNDIDLKQILNATDAQNSLFSSFGLNSFNSSSVPSVANLPLFSPLVDMSSTQALLNMVRTAGASGVSQLESYMKTSGIKRPPDIALNPLDLSSNSQPCNSKKLKRPPSSTDNFNATDNSMMSMTSPNQKPTKDRLQAKRTGSVSPKPRGKSSFLFSVPQNAAQIPIAGHQTASCLSLCTSSFDKTCPSRDGQDNVSRWTIDDVHNFVSSIDVCAEYADNFREQSIDGISLPLLTEEHLRTTINMKLGPALKFRAILAQKIGHCNVCMHCLHCHGTTGHSLTPLSNTSPTFHSTNRPNSAGN